MWNILVLIKAAILHTWNCYQRTLGFLSLHKVPFGDGVLATRDTVVGFEICEELWNPVSSHQEYYSFNLPEEIREVFVLPYHHQLELFKILL